MADVTVVYRLNKPSYDDEADIEILNINADIIDNAMPITINREDYEALVVAGEIEWGRVYNVIEDGTPSGSGAGIGDMVKAIYDTNNNGKVDAAENADTVGGFTISKNVPADAIFTDTVYIHPGSGSNPHNTTKADIGLSNVTNDKQMPISGGVLENHREKLVVMESGVINLNKGNIFAYSAQGNVTFSILNAGEGSHSFTLILKLTAEDIVFTFPNSVQWDFGTVPDISVNGGAYILNFLTIDGGVTWLGMLQGEFYNAPQIPDTPEPPDTPDPEDSLPVTQGLLGWWKFNDNIGTKVTDYSGNSKHGTIKGSGSTWTEKGLKTTLNSWIEMPHIDLYTGGSFTFIIACKYALAKTYPSLMGSYDEIIVYLNNGITNKTFAVQNEDGIDYIIGATDSLEADTPQVIAITYNNSSYVTYIDGVFNAQKNGMTGHIIDGSDPFYLSDPDGDTYRDNYEFYYALVYDRALSAQEIKDIYDFILTEVDLEDGSGGTPEEPEEPGTPEDPPANAINVVSYGAKGNGTTDDTSAIRSAINAVTAAANVVYFPAGTYMVNLSGGTALTLGSNTKMLLHPNAVIQAMPTNLSNYAVVATSSGANNVEITGGEIKGDRLAHIGGSGEWGHCIRVQNSTNVNIHHIKVSNSWGDGIYIIGLSNQGCSRYVTIKDFEIDSARRNGISVISGRNVLIENGYISNTSGTDPQSAIDLEPNYPEEYTQDIHIKNVIAENTTGYAFQWGLGAVYDKLINPIIVKIENFTSINHGYGKYNDWELFEKTGGALFDFTLIGEPEDDLNVNSIVTSMTSGWTATGGSITYLSGSVRLTGAGTSTAPRCGFSTAVPCVTGDKIYVRAKIKLPSDISGLNAVMLRAIGSSGGSNVNIMFAPTPLVANSVVDFYGIYTVPSDHTGNIRLEAHTSWSTASANSGKILDIQEYDAVNLTAAQGKGEELYVQWCNDHIMFNS